MKITDLTIEPFDLPLKVPFIVATGRKDAANNVLIKLTLEDGTVGYGEVSPSPYTTGDSQATAIATLEHLKPSVIGRDIENWRAILTETRRAIRSQTGAHSGLEIAVLDAFGKSKGVPLWQMWGGAQTEVSTDITLSLGSVEETTEAALTAVKDGFDSIKIKVGMGVDLDCARISAVHEAAPACELMLDANQGFTPKESVDVVRRSLDAGIELLMLEQPVRRDDFAGMRWVRDHCPIPVTADETVFTPEDAIRVVREGAADAINIKVAKAGLLGALDIAGIARAANLGVMIGVMMESKVGTAASVHLACGLGGFMHCDLDSVYLLKPYECEGGFNLNGPVFSVDGIGPGTGIKL